MDLLLDTHTLIWFLNGDEAKLSAKAKQLIADPVNTSFVSMACLWEMAIKIRLGTLSFEPGYGNLIELLDQNGFELLPITFQHTRQLLTLPMHHRDPFDRLMVAQTMSENLVFVTYDAEVRQYAIECIW